MNCFKKKTVIDTDPVASLVAEIPHKPRKTSFDKAAWKKSLAMILQTCLHSSIRNIGPNTFLWVAKGTSKFIQYNVE